MSKLGFSLEALGAHPDDSATEELVLASSGGNRLVFHFYPRAHKARLGLGGAREVYLGIPLERLEKVKGEKVRRFETDYILTRDPDGLSLALCSHPVTTLLGASLLSKELEFWANFSPPQVALLERERVRYGNAVGFLELCSIDSVDSHQLGYGSVHHVAFLRNPESEHREILWSTERKTAFGESKYVYSPCGLLCENVSPAHAIDGL